MKLFKKNENKKTTKLPMTGKVKKGFRYFCMAVMAMTFVLGTSVTAFAANDPIQVVNNLSDFIFGLVRAVGMIMLGFGIVQIGLSLKATSIDDNAADEKSAKSRCQLFIIRCTRS